jgi:hypothetical protein
MIKEDATRVGVEAELYSGHSRRAGGTTVRSIERTGHRVSRERVGGRVMQILLSSMRGKRRVRGDKG